MAILFYFALKDFKRICFNDKAIVRLFHYYTYRCDGNCILFVNHLFDPATNRFFHCSWSSL